MNKYLRKRRERDQLIPESILTDKEIAHNSMSNSELLSMANANTLRQRENLPLKAARFFQKYFLKSFNTCTDSAQLRSALDTLKRRIAASSAPDTDLVGEFENRVIRLAVHSCIARCAFAADNAVNDSRVDIAAVDAFFAECSALQLVSCETYPLVLAGYIAAHKQGTVDADAVKGVFSEFMAFVEDSDPKRPRNVLSDCPSLQGYIAQQHERYAGTLSDYLMFLLSTEEESDVVTAIEVFYRMMEERYLTPSEEARLALMREIGRRADSDSSACKEIARVFRVLASYTVNSPLVG